MQAVILCAGKGTRLNPLTETLPKVMLPVGGEPLLGRNISHLKRFGVDELFINLHYLPESITDYLGTGKKFDLKINYSNEKELLGTGGALNPFKKSLKKTFFLLYGDIFIHLDIDRLLKYHKQKKADITAVVTETDHPLDSDLVSLSSDLRVEKIYFKPHKRKFKTGYGLAAVYMIEPEALDLLPTGTFEFEKGFLQKFVEEKGSVYAYLTDELVKDIGTPERYAKVRDGIKDPI